MNATTVAAVDGKPKLLHRVRNASFSTEVVCRESKPCGFALRTRISIASR